MISNLKKPIYLDNAASTPIDKRVLEVMKIVYEKYYGNPHSALHSYGWRAEESILHARGIIAKSLKTRPKNIIFMPSATIANNLVLLSMLEYREFGNHIITCVTEHSAILEPCKFLEKQGMEVTYLPVDKNGHIDLNHFENIVRRRQNDTLLISTMWVNNETGVIFNIPEIARIADQYDIPFHTDASQAYGKLQISLDNLPIQYLTMSSHKMHGPQGVASLYISQFVKYKISPRFFGGHQEFGLNSGTSPTALIVGFGEAAKIAYDEYSENLLHINKLSSSLENCLNKYGMRNGTNTIPEILNFRIPSLTKNMIATDLRNIAFSTASACTNQEKLSHTLHAMDSKNEFLSIRLSLSRMNYQEEIDYVIQLFQDCFDK